MNNKDQVIFGIHAVLEAVKAGKELERVLVKRGASGENIQLLTVALKRAGIPFQFVPVEKLNSITRKNHQGVIAWISGVSYARIENILPGLFESGQNPLILILDQISDVRNFGAIARSAECAGVHALIIPSKGSARINSDAVKTSAGALHRIAVCRHDNLAEVARFCKNSGLKLFAATEKGNITFYNADFTGPVAIIMGAEDTGISVSLLREADELISVPMKGAISSLNVSVATGIVIYEALRQREF